MKTWRSVRLLLLGVIGLIVSPSIASFAEEPGAIVDGAGFTLYDTESIKGSDAGKVERDPVCDRNKLPRIAKVEPDEAKPGDKVVIEDGIQYNLVQCTMFNGVQHPSIILWKDGTAKTIREFTYQDFKARMG